MKVGGIFLSRTLYLSVPNDPTNEYEKCYVLVVPMNAILLTLVLILVIGAAFVLVELQRAPEGIQTEDGFNIVWKNNSPDLEDVSCVWTPVTARVM
jgi:hypothetical protein